MMLVTCVGSVCVLLLFAVFKMSSFYLLYVPQKESKCYTVCISCLCYICVNVRIATPGILKIKTEQNKNISRRSAEKQRAG